MKRLAVLLLVVATGTVALGDTVGARSKPSTCDLLTKKQVSKALGFKVVETRLERDTSTGAEQCEYRTKKYWTKDLRRLGAPLKMQVTTQPLTEDVESRLDTMERDGDPVAGLGERAFYTSGNGLVAVVEPVVILVEVTNIDWSGAELQKYILGPELRAMRILVDRFENV